MVMGWWFVDNMDLDMALERSMERSCLKDVEDV